MASNRLMMETMNEIITHIEGMNPFEFGKEEIISYIRSKQDAIATKKVVPSKKKLTPPTSAKEHEAGYQETFEGVLFEVYTTPKGQYRWRPVPSADADDSASEKGSVGAPKGPRVPEEAAKDFPIGTQKVGRNGKMYENVMTPKNQIRWKLVSV